MGQGAEDLDMQWARSGVETVSGWKKKFKGTERGGARIYTHPELDRAIVENHNGISFDGRSFPSVEAAKLAALANRPTAAP